MQEGGRDCEQASNSGNGLPFEEGFSFARPGKFLSESLVALLPLAVSAVNEEVAQKAVQVIECVLLALFN